MTKVDKAKTVAEFLQFIRKVVSHQEEDQTFVIFMKDGSQMICRLEEVEVRERPQLKLVSQDD